MASRVFISHAGIEAESAQKVVEVLQASGLEPLLDRERVATGESFIAFMEEALSTSDYCLLLWSAAAATRIWVQQEWEAALYRSIAEKRAFLAIGRLDAHPLPVLLAPRLHVKLFPQIEPGLGDLVGTWTDDRSAEEQSDRLVGPPPVGVDVGDSGEPVYVTSELFGITLPWRAVLEAPASLVLDNVIGQLDLPTVIDHDGRVGVRFSYHLATAAKRLDRGRTFAEQDVARKTVLWIESEAEMFAAAEPVNGDIAKATFRHANTRHADNFDAALRSAESLRLAQIDRMGLGTGRG